MADLRDTTVLITGASRGLGRALALRCAEQGASVAICARSLEPLEELAAELRSQRVRVLPVVADLGDERDTERLASTVLEAFGVVDILVNNASTLGPVPLRHLADASSQALAEALAVNVLGPYRLTRALIGPMLLRDHGLVVNLTSDAALEGYPGWGIYSAGKAALEALTRSFAAELVGTGVRVVAVDPGDMDTAMHRDAIPDADPASLRDPAAVARALVTLLGDGLPEGERLAVAL